MEELRTKNCGRPRRLDSVLRQSRRRFSRACWTGVRVDSRIGLVGRVKVMGFAGAGVA